MPFSIRNPQSPIRNPQLEQRDYAILFLSSHAVD
jgi:hypothetical protein